MGGHNLPGLVVWELRVPSLHGRDELPCAGLTCQALASHPEDNLAFVGFIDGTVRIWDLWDHSVVRDLLGHLNGTESIAVKDQNIWTGWEWGSGHLPAVLGPEDHWGASRIPI